MKLNKISIFHDAKLYPILDLDFCNSKNISLSELIGVWNQFPDCISFFQLRAKSLSESDYKNLYLELKKEFPNSKIIINDFWEVALEVAPFGLHIGKEDYENLSKLEKQKLKAGNDLLKGTSSHSLLDLLNLDLDFWDYTGFGPIFSTTTKKSNNQTLGVETLKKAIQQTKIPLVPIGGIDTQNFSSLYGFGKITPASISMMADEKSLVKIVDFIRKNPHPV